MAVAAVLLFCAATVLQHQLDRTIAGAEPGAVRGPLGGAASNRHPQGTAFSYTGVRFSQASVVIAGLAKDVGAHDHSNLAMLRSVIAHFAQARVVVYENNEHDPRFDAWQQQSADLLGAGVAVDLLFDPDLPTGRQHRTLRLAHGRNRILTHVRGLPRQHRPDYFMAFDMDGLNANLAGVETCERLPTGWGGCCANSRGLYYDLWALRTLDSWTDCDVFYECATPAVCRRTQQCLINARMRHIAPTEPPIEVRSCFGGAALYAWRYLEAEWARYSGGVAPAGGGGDGEEIERQHCEHVAFHDALHRQNTTATSAATATLPSGGTAGGVSSSSLPPFVLYHLR
eukprot:COSAG05_NODE_1368_length_5060_cov_5.437412_4_plen_342_part_00